MQESLQRDIDELLCAYNGLKVLGINDANIQLRGAVSFEAKYQDMECISDCFELELLIPSSYPKRLPMVKDVGGRIRKDYEHVNIDDSFCLAVPLEKTIFFENTPTLLGFMDNLVIPYLYSFCYWEKHSAMPYGEMSHGTKGIKDYYLALFESKKPTFTIKSIIDCLNDGYNAHRPCACGSGKKTCKCHKLESKLVANSSNKELVALDLYEILQTYYRT